MLDRVLILLSAVFILLAVWGGEPLSSLGDPDILSSNRISAPAPEQEWAAALQTPYPPAVNRPLFLPVIKKN